MPWNPDRYLQFERERYLPFEDLLVLIDRREGMRVIDLGCGTGDLTIRLADALPGSTVLGLDSSAEMLAKARRHARAEVTFEQRTVGEVTGRWDLVFSHAVIQWIEDHQALIPRLLALVRPGGQLAIQVPANQLHPTQRFILDLAAEEPFRSGLGGWNQVWPTLDVSEYAEMLHAHGGRNLTAMAKVYSHLLDDADAMADWMSGTALVPYFERLSDELRDAFMQRYRERLRARFPGSPVFFGFKRILLAATLA